MAFLIPEYVLGDFAVGEDEFLTTMIVPWEYRDDQEWREPPDKARGWFSRLSAPGYMDCTEWSGPFDTIEEAQADITETWDVDPVTGECLDSCC
jgi:hypothetical protein